MLVVVVVSDRGLAGGFNSNVLRHVEQLMKEKQAAGAQVDIVACGKKAVGYFNYRKIVPALEFKDLSADPTVEEASAIAAYALSLIHISSRAARRPPARFPARGPWLPCRSCTSSTGASRPRGSAAT